jgi:hypothetical protein
MNETTNDTLTETDTTNGIANGAALEPPKEAPKEPKETEAPKAGVSVTGAVGGAAKTAPRPRHTLAGTKEAPKAEALKTEAPKVEATKVNAPKEGISHEGLRLRMKVWSDPKTGKRYLMSTALMFKEDIPLGLMTAYAMTDDDTKEVKMTAIEWNALPFFYFQEDGPAPRASVHPVDVIR